jgi:hypothetical protein
VAVCVLAAAGTLLLPSFSAPATEMDEGALVAYPTLILDGAVPGRDFETFYGPGEPWLVAGAFELVGPSLTVQRVVGLGFRLLIVLALFTLALPWGRLTAAAAGLVAGLAMIPLGLAALAIFGAIALGLVGLAALSRTAFGAERSPRLAAPIAAGLASGLALLFRPDLAPAVALSSLPLLVGGVSAVVRRAYLAGAAIGLIPLTGWLAVVGAGRLNTLSTDLRGSRPGRHLPLPSLGSGEGQLLLAALAATALLIVFGGALVWRFRSEPRARLLLALGLFALCLVPSALQRADGGHIVPLACVALGGLVPLAVTLIGRRPRLEFPLARATEILAALSVSALAIVGIAHASGPTARDQISNPTYDARAFPVEYGDRSFPISSPQAARDINALLPEAEAATPPGGSIFVGPRDLRRTNYADTFIYYMLPELVPASYYTELNSGSANRSGSSLVDDLRGADTLILSTRWDDWHEPNASSDYASSEPNRVVEGGFCVRAREGSYRLYERCGRGSRR